MFVIKSQISKQLQPYVHQQLISNLHYCYQYHISYRYYIFSFPLSQKQMYYKISTMSCFLCELFLGFKSTRLEVKQSMYFYMLRNIGLEKTSWITESCPQLLCATITYNPFHKLAKLHLKSTSFLSLLLQKKAVSAFQHIINILII